MKTQDPCPDVSFRASDADNALIRKIATRAFKEAEEAGVSYRQTDAAMDLVACHANGCPLDLKKLLAANAGDFGHDVFGIRRFLDRRTGKLTQCFDPRCSLPES